MSLEKNNSILIVGGGTAGLVTALILKTRFSNLSIDLVKSDKVGIIGVGEGSTEHWFDFMQFVGISKEELIKETDATYKFGIMFEDWTDQPYFHNVVTPFDSLKFGQYYAGYAYSFINNIKPKQYTDIFAWDNKLNESVLPKQFHFNTNKLNIYLQKKCLEKNINIFEDEIKEVVIKNNFIDYLKGHKNNYKYSFYIDSTGFKKLLISKLGSKWKSYNKYLPMNEAIAFPTLDTEEYPPYTLAKAMSSGWMWRIPTNGRWGNGYVFNNNYINSKEAKNECEKYLGHEVNIGKNITFEAGALDKPWVGNCVATGLCSSFIEPLEASSIGTSIQQAFILMHLIINYDQKSIDMYNSKFKEIVENIRDFVLLHYLVKKKNSRFWKEFKPNIPASLQDNLEKWKSRLPIDEDFKNKYLLFFSANFAIVLNELNLLNKNKLKKEYDLLNINLRRHVETVYKNFKSYQKDKNYIDHKKYLKSIQCRS